ncbi:MAG: hypothetical protein NUV94_00225 [Candidatus Acetothermia bacterium]|jgi:hypothetical protein|nr:hypothetical protein [Candidatus Acetothermia bacterium]
MKHWWAVVLAVGVTALGTDVIPLSEVRPGMKGYGLTVVAGTEIARFDVEVVDILDEPGEANDFIIVRAYGDAIARSGGIAQGMSGSPVYLDGRLAGALSRAALWSAEPTRPLGLVTPIEAMLKVLAEVKAELPPPPEQEIPLPEGKKLQAWGIDRVRLVAAEPATVDEGTLVTWPLSAPVMASGLSERALSVLRDGLDLRAKPTPLASLITAWRGKVPGLLALGVPRVMAAPSITGQTPALPFVPGAPVGVGLVVGDVTVGALGTVTMTDGDVVLAFGHPFLFTGPSRYFLTESYVFDTVAALDAPYKFGALADVRGGVFADRWAAVGAVVGRTPAGIRTEFVVQDQGRGTRSELRATVVDEPRLSALLLYVSGLEAVDRALDRIGPGTAVVQYTITGRGMPRPLTRENVFLSTEDVAAYVPWEAAIVADILAYNEFQDPELTGISFTATVYPNFVAAEVIDLATEQDEYAPGDTVQFIVTVRGWRGKTEEWEGEIVIPADIDTPYVELRAYGGPRLRERGEGAPTFASLEDLIAYIEGIPTYDTLTVELFAVDPLSDLMCEPWLYGVDALSDRIPGTVVYGEVSLILPLTPKG